MNNKKKFWAAMMIHFLSVSFGMAEETEKIGDKPVITECEQEMIKAFNQADYDFQEHYDEFLNLPDITAVAKSTTGNIESYINTYQCHLELICPTITNVLYQEADKKVSFLIKQCAIDEKTEFTIGDVSKKLKADFSKCSGITNTQTASKITNRCVYLKNLKTQLTQNYAQSELIKNTALENNSFLSLKMIDMNKKLDELLEKVQTLVVHFKKVNDDIACINPDGTGSR